MPTIIEKTAALASVYGGQDTLNQTLKTIGTTVANEILREEEPKPPLKKRLVADDKDENYLLALSKYKKRRIIAQKSNQNDTVLQDITFRVLVDSKPVDTENSEADLKQFLIDLTNEIAEVTLEEENAVIPDDETLD